MLSDDTIKRMKGYFQRVREVMQAFDNKITEEQAWELVTCDAGMKALEVAERIDRRQEQQIQAELRSLSARASTFKSNIEVK